MKKKLFMVLLAVALLCASILPALANTIDEKQNELEEVEGTIGQRKEELSQNKQEQTKLLREIKLLESEVADIEAEIRSLNNKISTTEEEITVVEGDLVEAEENVRHMDEVLAVRLRAIHEHGKVSYLEVLLSSASFADFLTRYNDLRQVINEDKLLLTECQQERERIVDLKLSLEERRQELMTFRRDNLNKRQQMEVKQAKKENLVAALKADYEKTNREIEKLEKDAEELEEIIAQLEALRSGNAARGTGTLTWPVPEYGTAWITSGYGYRRDPITGKRGVFHGGIDIGIPHSRWPKSSRYGGNPVQVVAADAGIAYTYRMGSGYGNLVIVDHGDGVSTVYGHNYDFLVPNGTPVYKGQAISIIGSTGYSTGPHVHFEVRINGERVNPLGYVR